MFRFLAQLVCRRPWLCIGAWVGVAALSSAFAPSAAELQRSEPASLLPEDSPLNVGMRLYADAFPDQTARSRIVLVFERPIGLTADDRAFLADLARRLTQAGLESPEPWRVWSGELSPALRLRLYSADGQSAMIALGLDVNFLTERAATVVDDVERRAHVGLPEGLALEVTGTAAIGREHNVRSADALQKTTRMTIAAVLIILALVYRSPLGALVPLVSIGLSVFVAFRVLDFLAQAGWSISGAERMFTVVVLFGAGTNYALFWISRYRESLSYGRSRAKAVMEAMVYVGPAMLASAGTTIFGLMMLMAADMVIIHNSGKVLGLVLSISLLASMALTPAMVVVMGDAFFWPRSTTDHFSVGQRYIWPRLAKDLVKRPHVVFVCGLLLVSLPALSSFWVPLRYDSFGEIPPDTTAERGFDMVRTHFSEAEMFSTRFLLKSNAFDSDTARAGRASDELAARLAAVQGVSDVWHLGAPIGSRAAGGLASLLGAPVLREQVALYYFDKKGNVLQLEVMQEHPPMSLEAVAAYGAMREAIHAWAGDALEGGYTLHAVGQTPYIKDVQIIADGDLNRVIWLVIGVIGVIVLAVIRRPALTVAMLGATLISYAAAFGLTGWVFVDGLGKSGIDYKVRLLLFVIIVATGQDYNIFLVRRMMEEMRSFKLGEAITRSIVLTGPIISSCGMIMAATLGSLATTRVDLTVQLGFACAVGILIDTFLVRPLLIPSFFLICERFRLRRLGLADGNSPLSVPASAE